MQNFDITLKAHLELIKISIGTYKDNFDFSELDEEQWKSIIAESIQQSTALMCFDALKYVASKPSDSVYNYWFLIASKILSNNINVSNQQKILTDLLSENNIPYTILKGQSSAYYYEKGDYRSFGDVDFFVPSKDVETTKELLLKNDYSMHKDVNPIHYELHKNNTCFELHRQISGVPDNSYGKLFRNELDKIIDSRVMVNDFYKPCDYHHGIIILLHTLHHLLNSGIGLRHLCDWACFVNKTSDESFWENDFIPLLKSTGTFRFMCGITSVAVNLFDIKMPLWCNEKVDIMVETIIDEIISSGNFGRKKTNQPSLMMTRRDSGKTSVFSKISAMIKTLNRSNEYVCPYIKKAPIIYPFLMLYRIARYFVLMCLGKKPSLAQVSKNANERSAVFAKYELYNIEDK